MDWNTLKSGTDIRGLAVVDGDRPAVLTEAVGIAVGAAFADWLSTHSTKKPSALRVAAGCDSRVTGETLKSALIGGLQSTSVEVLDCGLCTTPAMFMTTLLAGCDGAVMVTASHMPWRQNGYKFFTSEGGLDDRQIREVLSLAAQMSASGQHKPQAASKVKPTPFLSTYADFLKQKVTSVLGSDRPLDGLHIVVDAGNGAGGFYAQMLASLGARIDGSQFLEPDGRFPNHIPNPEAPEAMRSLSDAVLRAGADLGVLFDADCDRAALVDGEGQAVNRNRLIALVTSMLLEEKQGVTIVTDSVTSAGLEDFLHARGGTLHRFKRGYHNVIDEARRLCAEGVDCPLAIETSGHAALRENHFLDDGMYLVTRLIVEATRMRREGKALFSLIDGLREPVESDEVRLPIRAAAFQPIGEDALASVEKAFGANPNWTIDKENREGVRAYREQKDQWFLLRLSVHDPLLVLNVESDREGGVSALLAELRPVLAETNELDLTALDARLT